MNTMIEKAKSLTVDELKIEIAKVMVSHEDHAGVLLDVLLSALETKISDEEFIVYCDSM